MINRISQIIFTIIEIVLRPYRGLGRIGRAEYINLSWLYTLIYMSVLTILFMIFPVKTHNVLIIVGSIVFFYFFILKISVKRLHDINFNGCWSLLNLLPLIFLEGDSILLIALSYIICSALILMLSFMPGTEEKNSYGKQPSAPSEYKIITAVFLMFFCIMLYISYIPCFLTPEELSIEKMLNGAITLKNIASQNN